MFKKILIANRGEIACRVMRTAKKMGIATVAVYSDADGDALHVQMADEKVAIGPAPSTESYLVQEAIIGAAKETGAEAIHPGYGFLSENAAFAKRLKKEGLVFIGPEAPAITAMGDKIESKKLAEKIGVNIIPGHTKAIKDETEALKIARDIGYPVMLKASAGGGGKGMRIARSDDEVAEGLTSSVREAQSSFGDDRVFIEKFIENPRHIEIQILADSHGNVVHLGERECSIQRRHQKVIEESPSPLLDAATRAAMGEQAIKLARAVDYVSAGTVEFVVDQEKNFYFLEMNTRLQVEHPVTELVTDLDLVEWMIRIADGEKLSFTQKQVRQKGWAVEARVYAEDPFRGFLPSIGRLTRYRAPEESDTVRVDSGVFEGGEISMHYDPMIAKLVSYGEDRALAITHLQGALDRFLIKGVSHNIGFLAALIGHPRFAEGRLSTAFIEEEYQGGFCAEDVPHDDPGLLVAVAAAMHRAYRERAVGISDQASDRKFPVADDWVALMDGTGQSVRVVRVDGGFEVVVAGSPPYWLKTNWQVGEAFFSADINGRDICVQVQRLNVGYRLSHSGLDVDIRVLAPRVAALYALMPKKIAPDTSKMLLSPMPGLLIFLSVQEGQEIKAGGELAIIEAMKMENVLRAEQDCTVKKVHVKTGDSLAVDQVIAEFE